MQVSHVNKDHLSGDELSQVLRLFGEVMPADHEAGEAHLSRFLATTPNATLVLVKGRAGRIMGYSIQLDRVWNYFGVELPASGMSYMAVDPRFQNYTVSEHLKEGIFDLLRKRRVVLSFGFARKAMDNYWSPYGFFGFTNFGRFRIEEPHLPRVLRSNITTDDLEQSDLEDVMKMYKTTYQGSLGPFVRDRETWQCYFDRERPADSIWKVFRDCEEKPIAYAMGKKGLVTELGLTRNIEPRDVLALLVRWFLADGEIRLEIGYYHPLSFSIRQRAHSFDTRFAWTGGHIVRIEDEHLFLKRIAPVLQDRLARCAAMDFAFDCQGFHFLYQDAVLRVTRSSLSEVEQFVRRDWSKLLLGVQSLDDMVCDLSTIGAFAPYLQVMFPKLYPQIPENDHF